MHANIKLLFWKEDSYADAVTEFLWVIVSVQNVAVQNGKSVGCSFWTARPSNMSDGSHLPQETKDKQWN